MTVDNNLCDTAYVQYIKTEVMVACIDRNSLATVIRYLASEAGLESTISRFLQHRPSRVAPQAVGLNLG